MARVQTGDIVQIRNNGRNYIVMGKAEHTDGTDRIILMKNGVIRPDGKMRVMPRRWTPTVKVINPNKIKRVHHRRQVDLADVSVKVPALCNVLFRMNSANGVNVMAPNISDITNQIEVFRR